MPHPTSRAVVTAKPPDLEWTVADKPVEPLPEGHARVELEQSGPDSEPITPAHILAYLMILVAAAALGFTAGRVQVANSSYRTDLETAVLLELRACREKDTDLLDFVLDPSDVVWRTQMIQYCQSIMMDELSAEIVALRRDSPTRARVELDITTKDGQRRETRHYRLYQGEWRRTAGPDVGGGASGVGDPGAAGP
jgi:hypothetical protein